MGHHAGTGHAGTGHAGTGGLGLRWSGCSDNPCYRSTQLVAHTRVLGDELIIIQARYRYDG
jgi:hypothetical protein